MRQEVLGEFSSLEIHSDGEIVVHAGTPEIRLVIELRVVGTRPWRGSIPLGNLLRLRIEHGHRVAVEFAAPHAVLRVNVTAAAAAVFGGEVIPNGFQRLAVENQSLSLFICMPYMLFCE